MTIPLHGMTCFICWRGRFHVNPDTPHQVQCTACRHAMPVAIAREDFITAVTTVIQEPQLPWYRLLWRWLFD